MKLRNSETGLTSIEIIIAVAVFVVLLGGIGSVVYFGFLHNSLPGTTPTPTVTSGQQTNIRQARLVSEFRKIFTQKGDIVVNGTGPDKGYVLAEDPTTKKVVARIEGTLTP